MKRILVIAVLTSAIIAAGATAAGPKGPRCAIKDPTPPTIIGAGPRTFLAATVVNRCLDPVEQMGTFACLEELEFVDGPPRLIECHANVDQPVLLTPHETIVNLVALCDYTTIPRIYRVTGYAWAVALDQARFQSPKMTSGGYGRAKTSGGTKRFCHVSKKHVEWRNK